LSWICAVPIGDDEVNLVLLAIRALTPAESEQKMEPICRGLSV